MQKSEQPHIELKLAMLSIDAMKTAASLDDFEESWKTFLHRIERIWNKVANHYGKSPKWNGWQGKFLKLRKEDPLLSYLINARGAEEHTVDDIVTRQAAGIGIGPAEGNYLYIEHMTIDGPNISIKSPQKIKIDFIAERTVPLPVKNRGRVYSVPISHLGNVIDSSSVIFIAEAGLNFYLELIKEVEHAFVR
jgi:hypothetical protein